MSAPVLASRAVLTKEGLRIDGKPFPFHIEPHATIELSADNPLGVLHVGILVDGPITSLT